MAYVALPMVAVVAIDAQSPTISASSLGPTFEVASIKPAPPRTAQRSPGIPMGLRVDRVQASFGSMSLSALISYAYRVKLAQISGPEWLAAQRFDIIAKLPEGGSMEHLPEMTQALLAQRFDLKLHRESKQFLVYALVPAKSGIKLMPKPQDFDPKAQSDQMPVPILSLTLLLEQIFDVPVIDETGLQGQYLFSSQMIREVMMAAAKPKVQSGAASASAGLPEGSEPEDAGATALLRSAGMTLEKKKTNLPVFVVESMRQTPTDN